MYRASKKIPVVKILWALVMLCFVLGVFLGNGIGFSKEKSHSIESVIDKLERKLSSESNNRIHSYNATEKQIDIKTSSSVEAKLQEMQAIELIEKEVSQLDALISNLSDEVANTAQDILANAAKDNRSIIKLDLSKITGTKPKYLEVSLDDHRLFKFNASYHVSMPIDQVLLYIGSLTPGNHTLTLSASFNKMRSENISVESEKYIILNESKNFTIEKSDKQIEITTELALSNEQNSINMTIIKKLRDLANDIALSGTTKNESSEEMR